MTPGCQGRAWLAVKSPCHGQRAIEPYLAIILKTERGSVEYSDYKGHFLVPRTDWGLARWFATLLPMSFKS